MKQLKEWLTSCASYVGSNLSYTYATDMFVSQMPTEPPDCIALIPAGGPRIVGSPMEFSHLQVLVRHPDPEEAITRVTSIHALFDNKWCALSPTFCGRFYANHEPGAHICDENGHAVYSLNYTFARVRQ